MRVVAAGLWVVLSACTAYPVNVQLEAVGPRSAQVVFREIGASTDTAPERCETPCALVFQPETAYELELRAPGYQRARIAISYIVMRMYKGPDKADPILRIPMLEAPAIVPEAGADPGPSEAELVAP